MKHKRVLLKLSGEILRGDSAFGIEERELVFLSEEILSVVNKGIQIGVVIGGGNIFRGSNLVNRGLVDRMSGDYMGMLSTVINGLALKASLEKCGVKSKLITAFNVEKVGEVYNQELVKEYLKEGYVLIFTAGTSNPLFTTDSAAALRAAEINADVLLKGTKVDGVYSADPEKDPNAERFEDITFDEVYKRGLKVMDLTAFTICKENNVPLVVFKIKEKGSVLRALEKGDNGTLVHL